MRHQHGLRQHEEIHAGALINRPGDLKRIGRHDRLKIIRNHAKEISQLENVSIINVIVTKRADDDPGEVFDKAWRTLIQRFANTMEKNNFPVKTRKGTCGLVICDKTDPRVNNLLRKMRRYNPIPNSNSYGPGYRDIPLPNVLEDPTHRDSRHSLFLQAADTVAYLLHQHERPNSFFRKMNAEDYFLRLEAVLCKQARPTDPLGIVRL